MINEEFFKAVDTTLKSYGFTKKTSNTWSKELKETYLVIVLRRSKWGNQYSIYLGIFFRNHDMSGYPQVHKSHFNFPISDVFTEDDADKYKFFDLDKNIDHDDIVSNINKQFNILKEVIPYVETKEGIRNMLKQYPNLKYRLSADAIKILNFKI